MATSKKKKKKKALPVKLPFSKVKIGPHNYRVKVVSPAQMDPPTPAAQRLINTVGKHQFHYGDVVMSDLLIRISNAQDPSMAGETVLHEITHVIIDEAGINRTLKRNEEEAIVQTLAFMLLQVLRDNPELAKFLLRTK